MDKKYLNFFKQLIVFKNVNNVVSVKEMAPTPVEKAFCVLEFEIT